VAVEYKSIEYRLHESLVQIQEMLSILEFDQELLQIIVDCKDLIKMKKYNVAVMGEFKRGKSSLINALLGSRILPADSTPTTATVNRITYGTEPKAVITYKEGTSKEINIEDLSNYVTKITPEGETRAMKIKEATVYYPTVICQNHIDIIDTPGLNDDERMTQITIEMINHVDAVIIPIHARAPFSETEKKFVCQLINCGNINNLVFVVTYMDQLDEDDYRYEEFMNYIQNRIKNEVFKELMTRDKADDSIAKAHLLLDHMNICGISSALALKSFTTNNRELLRQSRFEEFHTSLLRVVTAKQLENAVRKAIEIIKQVISQFEFQNSKRIKCLKAKLDSIGNDKTSLIRYSAGSIKDLDSSFAKYYDDLQKAVSGLNTYKNFIVKEFIKSLSELRTNTHEVIENAMHMAASRVIKIINEQQKTVVNMEILRAFENTASELALYQKNALGSAYEELCSNIDLAAVNTNMLRFAGNVLSNVSFTWSISPVPKVYNLTNCNVIDAVVYAADVSVQSYIKEMNEAISSIRKKWFDQMAVQNNKIHHYIAQVIDKEIEEYDTQYKAYTKNYQVLKENSKNILAQCEAIWDEFTKN
jgi:hypothetical protein